MQLESPYRYCYYYYYYYYYYTDITDIHQAHARLTPSTLISVSPLCVCPCVLCEYACALYVYECALGVQECVSCGCTSVPSVSTNVPSLYHATAFLQISWSACNDISFLEWIPRVTKAHMRLVCDMRSLWDPSLMYTRDLTSLMYSSDLLVKMTKMLYYLSSDLLICTRGNWLWWMITCQGAQRDFLANFKASHRRLFVRDLEKLKWCHSSKL